MLSPTEENYIKTIYALEIGAKKRVSTNLIAEQLETKASSVTDMIKRLAEKDLLVYEKYRGVKLSPNGKKMAARIVRKHRLWECFLVDKLHFSWDEVHDIAEQLEHIQSEKLTEKLASFLDYPSVDPHGDPIPDKFGNIIEVKQIPLATLEEKEESVLLGLKDSSDDFLKYLNKKNISLGKKIKVISIEPFDRSMEIELNNQLLSITEAVAKNLLVKER
ncbi:metal-dependent transcriptional regulator [Flavobacteriaceae bacterium F08102]|nr:metal-dependent transcriptional regulator [Flavobacteriaceae bacterium F08102]